MLTIEIMKQTLHVTVNHISRVEKQTSRFLNKSTWTAFKWMFKPLKEKWMSVWKMNMRFIISPKQLPSFKFNYYISLVQQMGNDFAYNLLCSPWSFELQSTSLIKYLTPLRISTCKVVHADNPDVGIRKSTICLFIFSVIKLAFHFVGQRLKINWRWNSMW